VPLPDIDSFDTLAGPLSDYSEVLDPEKDLPSKASNIARADTAAMTRMIQRIDFTWSNSDPTTTEVSDFDSVVGNSETIYPILERLAVGHWKATFVPAVLDVMGEESAWNFRRGQGDVLSATPGKVQVVITSPNTLEMYLWILPGLTADDLQDLPIRIQVW